MHIFSHGVASQHDGDGFESAGFPSDFLRLQFILPFTKCLMGPETLLTLNTISSIEMGYMDRKVFAQTQSSKVQNTMDY